MVETVITTKIKGEPADSEELEPKEKPLTAVVQLGKELKDVIRTLLVTDWQYVNIRLTNRKGGK